MPSVGGTFQQRERTAKGPEKARVGVAGAEGPLWAELGKRWWEVGAGSRWE